MSTPGRWTRRAAAPQAASAAAGPGLVRGRGALEDQLAYFYELRLRVRGLPEATAIIDRCIVLIVRAQDASETELQVLAAEVEALRADLVARFGEPPPRRPH